MVTGPFRLPCFYGDSQKDIYRHYIGLDSCMADLMRPALYGSYHPHHCNGERRRP